MYDRKQTIKMGLKKTHDHESGFFEDNLFSEAGKSVKNHNHYNNHHNNHNNRQQQQQQQHHTSMHNQQHQSDKKYSSHHEPPQTFSFINKKQLLKESAFSSKSRPTASNGDLSNNYKVNVNNSI